MIKSMTAFGKAAESFPFGMVNVELSSTNRKFLEIKISLPSELRRFEPALQKCVSSQVARGALFLKVSISFSDLSPVRIEPNTVYAKELKKAASELAEALSLDKERFTHDMLSRSSHLVHVTESFEHDEEIEKALLQVTEAALKPFLDVKVKEGAILAADMRGRIDEIEKMRSQVELLSKETPEQQQEKLKKRLEEYCALPEELEAVVAREVALFADKVDVTEELVRLEAHLNHFRECLDSDHSSGKTMEFILQEMVREINTTGSKSQNQQIARLVVQMKAEVEKIKEQIQNIE